MEVYHAQARTDEPFARRDINYDLYRITEEIKVAIAEGKVRFVKVATLKTSKLETAFRLTNTIDAPWWENQGVEKHFTEEGCRSTSVGDVVVNETTKEAFLCCAIGWSPLKFDLALHEEVFSNLDNALDSGYGIVSDTPKAVAEDMIECVSTLENASADNLIPHILAWQANLSKETA